MARPWQTMEEQTIKNLVPHMPRQCDQRTRVPRAPGGRGRRTWWTYHTRVGGASGGGCHRGTAQTRAVQGPPTADNPGDHSGRVAAEPCGGHDHQRGAVAWTHWARKSGPGWSAPQVRGDKDRREQSMGMAVLASWCVRCVGSQEIVPDKSWRSLQRQHTLRLRGITNQVESAKNNHGKNSSGCCTLRVTATGCRF
jgi:hypothetical protein